jgi:hypothetical protein
MNKCVQSNKRGEVLKRVRRMQDEVFTFVLI